MLRTVLNKAIILFLFIGSALMTANAQNYNLNDPIPFNPNVIKGKLDNGLTYYIQSNPKPEKKIELRLVLNAGSILENDNQQGLAHFMEHMNFNGLKSFPKNELVHYLQSIGVKFGADLNANTDFDRTYYILPVPTDNPENLKKGFQILSEWAGGALITNEEVEDERHVIYEEYRLSMNSATNRMMRKYLPAMLNNSRYASRLPIGTEEVILKGDPERIREYYRDWYRPNLMAVIVVGDIEAEKAKSLVEEHFSYLKNPANEKPRTVYEVKPYTASKAMIVTDAEATNYSFNLMFSAKESTPDVLWKDYRNSVVENIFVQSLNKKFRELTQKAQPPYASAFASLSGTFGSFTLKNEGFSMYITPTDNMKGAIDSAIAEILYVQQYGFTESEIEITKNNLLAAYEKSYNERGTKNSSSLVDEFARNFMNQESAPGIENEYQFLKQILPGITSAEVSKLAEQILSDNKNIFALITGPEKGDLELPTEAELLSIVENAFKQNVAERAAKEQIETLLTKEPIAGKIVKTQKDKELAATTYTLSNGVKVTIKSTDFKSDEILFSAVKKGGIGLYGPADRSNVNLLSTIIETMGYGEFTPTELSNFLSGKNVSLVPALGPSSNVMSGSSSIKDFKTLLELNYLQLTEPRIDNELFEGFMTKMKTQLKFLKANPQMAFLDTLNKAMYNDYSLTPLSIPTEEDLEKLSASRVVDIYKEQFGNADGFHFFIVGNVDEKEIKPLLEKYIASLPVKNATPNFKDNGLRMVSGNKELKFYKGSDQKSLIIKVFHGENVKYSQELALKANLLGQALTMEILDTIREKYAYIYSGGANASVKHVPYEQYALTIQMPCGPENVDKILEELDREIAGFQTNGGPEGYLEKAKIATIKSYEERIKTNGYWATQLQQILFWEMDKKFILNYDKQVKKVTKEDIIKTAQLFFGSNSFTAVSFPELTTESDVEPGK